MLRLTKAQIVYGALLWYYFWIVMALIRWMDFSFTKYRGDSVFLHLCVIAAYVVIYAVAAWPYTYAKWEPASKERWAARLREYAEKSKLDPSVPHPSEIYLVKDRWEFMQLWAMDVVTWGCILLADLVVVIVIVLVVEFATKLFNLNAAVIVKLINYALFLGQFKYSIF